MQATRLTVEERFWAKVDRSGGPDACWPWTAGTFKHRYGYGQFQAGTSRTEHRPVYAHRFAWELTHGPIAPGMVACHSCDNTACCNPAHIFIGTQADNIADMTAKGRHHYHGATHCKRGHEFTPENTGTQKGRWRFCRTCKRDYDRQRQLRKSGRA